MPDEPKGEKRPHFVALVPHPQALLRRAYAWLCPNLCYLQNLTVAERTIVLLANRRGLPDLAGLSAPSASAEKKFQRHEGWRLRQSFSLRPGRSLNRALHGARLQGSA